MKYASIYVRIFTLSCVEQKVGMYLSTKWDGSIWWSVLSMLSPMWFCWLTIRLLNHLSNANECFMQKKSGNYCQKGNKIVIWSFLNFQGCFKKSKMRLMSMLQLSFAKIGLYTEDGWKQTTSSYSLINSLKKKST